MNKLVILGTSLIAIILPAPALAQVGPAGVCAKMSRAQAREHLRTYLVRHPEALGNAGWEIVGSSYSVEAKFEIWRLDLGGKVVVTIPIPNKCPHQK